MKRSLLYLTILGVLITIPANSAVTVEEMTDAEYVINAGYSQAVAEDILHEDIQFILLGTGDSAYENYFRDLANRYEEFKEVGCEIYSVSTDTHFVHKAWHDASERIKKIEYVMLADPTHKLSKDFEVYIEEDGLAERGTFVVNPEGKIVAYEVNAGNVGRNAEELLRKVLALQFVAAHGDEVCPAKWKPGEETLKPSLDLVGQL